jgi:hypothetical protein
VEKHGLYVAEKYSWTIEPLHDVEKSNLWKLITKIFLSTLRGQRKLLELKSIVQEAQE